MFGPVYTGMSGLMTFSKGLEVVSNNVANLNTPGHKRSDLMFQDLYYRYNWSAGEDGQSASGQIGSGVTADRTTINFSQGELRESGSNTDVAIDGNGFFILRDGDKQTYTRAGQFVFDGDGYLVTQGTKERVAGYDGNGLTDINIAGNRTSPPKATSEVKFTNNLSTGSNVYTVNDVSIYDATGEQHALSVKFTNNSSVTARSWLVEVKDDAGNVIGTGAEIRFQENGSPQDGFNTYVFSMPLKDGTQYSIKLNLGDPGVFTGVTSFSGGDNSNISVKSQDGYAHGSITSTNFDADGNLEIKYSNGQSFKGAPLALAWFSDLQALQQMGKGEFYVASKDSLVVGKSGQGVFGKVMSKHIELSNVELTSEFSNLIIIQRGFQGASQIVTAANEMIQQLLAMGHSK